MCQLKYSESKCQIKTNKALIKKTSLSLDPDIFSHMPLFASFIGFIRLLFQWVNDKTSSTCSCQRACCFIIAQRFHCLNMTNAKHMPIETLNC